MELPGVLLQELPRKQGQKQDWQQGYLQHRSGAFWEAQSARQDEAGHRDASTTGPARTEALGLSCNGAHGQGVSVWGPR